MIAKLTTVGVVASALATPAAPRGTEAGANLSPSANGAGVFAAAPAPASPNDPNRFPIRLPSGVSAFCSAIEESRRIKVDITSSKLLPPTIASQKARVIAPEKAFARSASAASFCSAGAVLASKSMV